VDKFITTVSSKQFRAAIVPGFLIDFNCHGSWDSAWIKDRPIDGLNALKKLREEFGNIRPFAVLDGDVSPPAQPIRATAIPKKNKFMQTTRAITLED
jgi:hypothetical protein